MVDQPRNEEHRFDEALISGYIDGELTQADRQRVALHIEVNADARSLYEQLREAREAALGTPFPIPDDQWNEEPRGALSKVLRSLGLLAIALAVLGWIALVFLVGRSELEERWVMAIPGTGIVGTVFVLTSVLIDRLATSRHDIYRNVKK